MGSADRIPGGPPGRRQLRRVMALIAAVMAGPASAQLLTEGQDLRQIPFRQIEAKPFVAVEVEGAAGWMMVDTGTPDALFLNRAALTLGPAPEVGRGFAASGQEVVVWLHDAPAVSIGGQSFKGPAKLRSGDFSFAMPIYGADFMGFIGTPALQDNVFLIDYGREVVRVMHADAAPPPNAADLLGQVDFAIWPGAQPTMAGLVGDRPMLVDMDSGDGGTLYLAPQTKADLLAAGQLRQGPDGLVLAELVLGGVTFHDLPLAEIVAGGPQDMRSAGALDLLRLGARFLAAHPVLWDFPARRLVFLRPGASYPPAPN